MRPSLPVLAVALFLATILAMPCQAETPAANPSALWQEMVELVAEALEDLRSALTPETADPTGAASDDDTEPPQEFGGYINPGG